MCKAFKDWGEEERNKGRREGRREGMREGRREGKRAGLRYNVPIDVDTLGRRDPSL